MNIFFQIFILVDVFIAGGVTVVAVQHLLAHKRQHKPRQTQDVPAPTEEFQAKLQHQSELRYSTVLHNAVKRLETDLASSSDQINGLIKRFAGEIVGQEMQRYRTEFQKLHMQAEEDLGGVNNAMQSHQTELRAKLAADIEAEKQSLLRQIDTKLGDAMGSFLVEALQYNVDLGGQTDYLISLLEEHKEEFKKELAGGEVKPTK